MRFLELKAFYALLQIDVSRATNFSALYDKVRCCRVRPTQISQDATAKICASIDIACTWYWKDVLCLQRSAATTWMLRRHGVAAELIIGIQQLPFRAHAWVDVGGRVVNDKEYVSETYLVLDRC
jgi:hypothetical protein